MRHGVTELDEIEGHFDGKEPAEQGAEDGERDRAEGADPWWIRDYGIWCRLSDEYQDGYTRGYGPDIEIHHMNGFAAVYLNGTLVRGTAGSLEAAKTQALDLAGVKVTNGDGFLLGFEPHHEHVANTVADIREFTELRTENVRRAAELEAEAQQLLADAQTLRHSVGAEP